MRSVFSDVFKDFKMKQHAVETPKAKNFMKPELQAKTAPTRLFTIG